MKSTIRIAALIAVAASSVLTGCASIVNGTNQVVSVETRSKNQQITGATCKLDNGEGIYYVTTPGTVTVHRAYDDMTVVYSLHISERERVNASNRVLQG